MGGKETKRTNNVCKTFATDVLTIPSKVVFITEKDLKIKVNKKIRSNFTLFTHADIDQCKLYKYLCRC